MKNIFNKTNAPYLAGGVLATLALVSSGVVGVLTAVAVFNASLPLIAGLVGFAVFSAATIALSAVAISKNNAISESIVINLAVNCSADISSEKNAISEKSTEISSLEKQLAKKEKAIEAKNKMIANPNKDDELKRQHRKEKQEEVLDSVALSNLFDENSEKKAEVSSPANEPAREENGQGWGAWGKVAKIATAGIGLCGAALCCAAPYISTALNGVVASSVGSELGYTNGTMCYPH